MLAILSQQAGESNFKPLRVGRRAGGRRGRGLGHPDPWVLVEKVDGALPRQEGIRRHHGGRLARRGLQTT